MKIPANKNQQQTFPDYELFSGILSDNLLDVPRAVIPRTAALHQVGQTGIGVYQRSLHLVSCLLLFNPLLVDDMANL